LGNAIEVFSAGLEKSEVNPLTLQVLEEDGISTHGLYAKPLADFMGRRHFSYLITVCDRANERCPIFPGMGKRLSWPFDDSAGVSGTNEEKLAVFRLVRDEIDRKLDRFIEEENLRG